jgi:hypothetical protein
VPRTVGGTSPQFVAADSEIDDPGLFQLHGSSNLASCLLRVPPIQLQLGAN